MLLSETLYRGRRFLVTVYSTRRHEALTLITVFLVSTIEERQSGAFVVVEHCMHLSIVVQGKSKVRVLHHGLQVGNSAVKSLKKLLLSPEILNRHFTLEVQLQAVAHVEMYARAG